LSKKKIKLGFSFSCVLLSWDEEGGDQAIVGSIRREPSSAVNAGDRGEVLIYTTLKLMENILVCNGLIILKRNIANKSWSFRRN